jgi:acetyl-CoA acyltransferase
MKNIVIAGYARSPFTPAKKGSLVRFRPDELAAEVIRALVDRTGVKAEDIEDIIVGCSFPEGEQGFNVARLIGLLADMPLSVAGTTVNRFCGSSMTSVHMAAGAIQMNAGEVFLCVGVESMSRVPMGGFNPMPSATLYAKNADAYMGMGETAENVATRWQITRGAQEAFALASHAKAAAAQADGRLTDEIVPVTNGKITVSKDECIRADSTAEGLAGLKPAFSKDGSVTAGTSSPLNRGVRGGAQPADAGAHQSRGGRRLRAGHYGHGPGRRLAQSAGARWHHRGRYRRGGAERGVRLTGAGLHP